MKRTLSLFPLCTIAVLFLLTSCQTDNMVPTLGPIISSFMPVSGKPGDTVVIYGYNFSSPPSANTLTLNGTPVKIVNGSGDKLTVIVPAAAITGKFAIAAGIYSDTAADVFTVTGTTTTNPPAQAPVITSFTPASGAVGASVTINGSNFGATIAGNTVQFNGVTATVTAASATQLTVTVPATATTGKITVTVNSQSGVSATDFTVSPSGPVVTSFSPALGLPGDVVIISGTGFSTTVAQNTVTFSNGVTATISAATPTQLTVTVPTGAMSGTLSVAVGGQTATSTATFEVLLDIPRSGLVAFYPFSGNANDASGNGFNLTLSGNYAPVTDHFGNPGKAYYFDGSNSYAASTDAAAAAVTQPMTVSAWIKYDSMIPSDIVAKFTPGAPGGYVLGVFGFGANRVLMTTTDHGQAFNSGATLPPVGTNGNWILIAMTYDGTTLQWFKDGALVGTSTLTGTITATAGNYMHIGPSGSNSSAGLAAFKCSIDDVTVYNRVLSNAEMMQLFNATVSKK